MIPHSIRSGPPCTLVLTLLSGMVLVGCMPTGKMEPPAPAPQEAAPVELPLPEVASEPEEVPVPDRAAILDDAELALSDGNFRRARRLFEGYLNEDRMVDNGPINPSPPQADRAYWGLAMIYLLPDSPFYDQELAVVELERLEKDHGDTARGVQAAWIRGVLDELDQVRAQAHYQEELLRQLTETVEQLKRIDLNRRPTGSGTTVRNDTIPPGR